MTAAAKVFALGRALGARAATAAHHPGEQVFKARTAALGTPAFVIKLKWKSLLPPGRRRTAERRALAKPPPPHLRILSADRSPWDCRRADGAGIELGALVLVAQDVIGGGNFLELLLRAGIAGMLVGMMLLGQVAEGLLDVGFRRRPLGTPRTS